MFEAEGKSHETWPKSHETWSKSDKTLTKSYETWTTSHETWTKSHETCPPPQICHSDLIPPYSSPIRATFNDESAPNKAGIGFYCFVS